MTGAQTVMGSAEFVSFGDDKKHSSTLQTVLDLKSRGVTVFSVETTEISTTLWDATMYRRLMLHTSLAINFLMQMSKCLEPVML
eukprot:CCRYP_009705-RA/>CCRYP_009705-RA protein AED:0.56 eAED:0.53 QI:0/0/0/0.5/1/1/2/0/83